jgi:hypothetical protein
LILFIISARKKNFRMPHGIQEGLIQEIHRGKKHKGEITGDLRTKALPGIISTSPASKNSSF